MKILKNIMLIVALCCFSACSEEELTGNLVDCSTPYVIVDNPDDAVAHRCYQIYEKYQVPVFFRDTLTRTFLGLDIYGDSLFRYETIDMNWNFTSHTGADIEYRHHYITDEAKQMEALDFVETYLSLVSEKMRPFCILLTDTTEVISAQSTETPEFIVNFRALVLSQILQEEGQEPETGRDTLRAQEIIRSMVWGRVQANDRVKARFGAISSKENWYERPWKPSPNDPNNNNLGCSYQYTGDSWILSYNYLYSEEDIPDILSAYGWTFEEFTVIRDELYKDIGQFGFICGDKYVNTSKSPDADYDLEYYVNKMLELSYDEFMKRYGMSPLVVEKYNILYDFIAGELGVDLKGPEVEEVDE